MIGQKMREQNSPDPFHLKLTFEKGEHRGESYEGHFEVCDNPLCKCHEMKLIVESVDEQPSDMKRYGFFIDVLKKRIADRKGDELSAANRDFARSFVNELKEEQWAHFQSLFYSYKVHITKNCDIQELDATFSVREIEQEKLMVDYQEIFPYAEAISCSKGDTDYFFHDQYCLNPKCSCSDAVLVIVAVKNGKVFDGDRSMAVRYDYRDRKWRPDDACKTSEFFLRDIMSVLSQSFPDISSMLRKRHRNLRIMYENYKRKNAIGTSHASRQKVGRNDPCPCGSGKKYKMCCGS